MSQPANVSGISPVLTWELLKALGFVDDHTMVSDDPPGLSFDFGNLKLHANCVTNLQFVRIVLMTGVIVTARTIAEVDDELPLEFESAEQGTAWITWCLDEADGGIFEPVFSPSWLAEGRKYRHLLPWERERAA